MLSGVKLISKGEAEKLDAKEKHKDHKHKKHKKHSKDKKHKKEKFHKTNDSGISSPEQDSPRCAAIEQKDVDPKGNTDGGQKETIIPDGGATSTPREDWMTVPMGVSIIGGTNEKPSQEQEDTHVKPNVVSVRRSDP